MVKNLKKLRTDKKLSQQQLGMQLQISQQSINKYENHNIEPDIDTLIQMAKIFNTSVDYLIGNTEINRVIESVKPYELSEREAALLRSFRELSDMQKQSIEMVIHNFLEK